MSKSEPNESAIEKAEGSYESNSSESNETAIMKVYSSRWLSSKI